MAYDIFRGQQVGKDFSRGEPTQGSNEVGAVEVKGDSPWKWPALVAVGALGFSLLSLKMER